MIDESELHTSKQKEQKRKYFTHYLHFACVEILMEQFRSVCNPPPVRTIIDLDDAMTNWYMEHFKSSMDEVVKKYCEEILRTAEEKQKEVFQSAQLQIKQLFEPKVDKLQWPEVQVVEQRATKIDQLLIPPFEEILKQYSLNSLPSQKLVAEFLLHAFEHDLNIYRPDFEKWNFKQVILQKKELAQPEKLSGEQRRQKFRLSIEEAVKKGKNATFIPFDQGLELAYAILKQPLDYPPAVWNGVCEAKVLQVLCAKNFNLATTLSKEDAQLQEAYVKNEGAKDEYLKKFDLKEFVGKMQRFDSGENLVESLFQTMNSFDQFTMVKVGITHPQIGGHAIAMQCLGDKLFSIYDPNIGLFQNISQEVFQLVWTSIYEEIGYTGYNIVELLDPQVAQLKEQKREEEEKKLQLQTTSFKKPVPPKRQPPSRKKKEDDN